MEGRAEVLWFVGDEVDGLRDLADAGGRGGGLALGFGLGLLCSGSLRLCCWLTGDLAFGCGFRWSLRGVGGCSAEDTLRCGGLLSVGGGGAFCGARPGLWGGGIALCACASGRHGGWLGERDGWGEKQGEQRIMNALDLPRLVSALLGARSRKSSTKPTRDVNRDGFVHVTIT